MQDDFNTPLAISVMFELAREINRQKSADMAEANRLACALVDLGNVLGLLQENAESFFQDAGADDIDSAEIDTLVQNRLEARRKKNWAESDRIRDLLKDKGIVLEDSPTGTTWRRQ
jgi:cysteinyl-tRNA synthetase